MTTRRPRTVLTAAFALLAVLLGLFAFALLRANSNERRDAEHRFNDRAAVSAALIEGLFGSVTGAQNQQQSAERYGGPVVSSKILDAQAKESRLAYMAVYDDQGRLMAATTGLDPDTRRRLTEVPQSVEAVMKGAPYSLTDFLESDNPLGVMEFGSRFTALDGKDRYTLSAFTGAILSAFIGGYLGSLPDSTKAHSFVLDSQGKVIGSPVKGQIVAKPVAEPGLLDAMKSGEDSGTYTAGGTERAYALSRVDNATWRVVLTMPTATLYAGTSSVVEWLILIALAAAGLTAVFLLSRMAKAALAVQAANEQLERSNAELEHSNLELQRSNAELEQFASVASHDLQEPLRKVQTFGDQIERRFGDEMPDEAKDYLRRMRNSAHRMSTLIEDLLRFSRVTTHAKPPTRVDLGVVAREVTSDLDALLQETHGTVEIGPMPSVQADPMQMRQLLQNLIANAIKFHRPGVSPEVQVRSVRSPAPGMAAFEVADNGIGFEEQYSERIFRVFERLHPRDVFEGTGIGLALCRKIVERHGGSVVAKSTLDEGSTFTVLLPIDAASAINADGGSPADAREPVHA